MTPGNVLISSAGRRVGLLACVRESISKQSRAGTVFAVDAGASAPATFLADGASSVVRCTSLHFAESVLELCKLRDISLVIPTIDTELPAYASARARFAEVGVTVSVSSEQTVAICCNKIKTHKWLTDNGFPTVRQTDFHSALLQSSEWPVPFIVKPYNGSASTGVRQIRTRLELAAVAEMSDDLIAQELATGREYTVNVYVDRSGRCLCAVPHWRMEVRAGEVSKGITVKDRRLMDLAKSVAEALPGAYGPLNIQCFMSDSGKIQIIEINARFGGGYPLAHRAGARFTDWLLDEMEGKVLSPFEDWTDDLAMLRYDEAVFVPGSSIRP